MTKFITTTNTKLTKNGKLVIEVSVDTGAQVGDIFGYLASSIPADQGMSPRQRVRAEQAAIAAGHTTEVPRYRCVGVGDQYEAAGYLYQYAYVEEI